MKEARISKQILEAIRQTAGDAKPVGDFLIELIDEESRHVGQWWFRDPYRKRIEEYSQNWEVGDEEGKVIRPRIRSRRRK